MAKRTDDEMKKILGDLEMLYVPHVWGDEAMRALAELRVDGRGPTTAKGLVICGDAGAGKTQVFLAWMGQFPLIVRKPFDCRPVAYAKIVGGRGKTLGYRSIAADILAAFGDDVVGARESQRELIDRIIRRAREQNTEVLGIDEAHLMLRSTNAAEFTKTLMNEAPFALVFIGDPVILDVYDTNGSFERRVDEIVFMKFYNWSSTQERRVVRQILREQDRCLPFQSGLDDYDLAAAIVASARGSVGRQTRLVRKAFARADRRGATRIGWRDFEIVHDRIDPRAKHRGRNPFRNVPAAQSQSAGLDEREPAVDGGIAQ